MIKNVDLLTKQDIDILLKSPRGKRIYSYYVAYETKYDFCRFFYIYGNNPENHGIMLLINSTLEGICSDDVDVEELVFFIMQHKPFRVQLDEKTISKLIEFHKKNKSDFFSENYRILRRNIFELNGEEKDFQVVQDINDKPKLDNVYSILEAGFPNLLEKGLWLTDTSHRIRHNISKCLIYKNVTTATILYDITNTVLIGQVATVPEYRGLGYARDFLRCLGYHFKKEKRQTAILYALDIRKSFYEEIGFNFIGEEFVFEYIPDEKDDLSKGEL